MQKEIKKIKNKEYKYGFITNIKQKIFKKGINKNIIKEISNIKKEPKFILKWRIKAYKNWKKMKEPKWSSVKYKKINYQNISYFAKPEINENKKIKKTYNKLGLQVNKKNTNTATDFIFDSVSIMTTYKKKLLNKGIIFCSISEAIKKYPKLIKKYMGSVVNRKDNYFAALNAAIFTDGSFIYIPENTKCPMELTTYFRINASNTGQFERTLIIADNNSYVSYLEGCTAPIRKTNQLHSAVVELIAMDNAIIKYSTVQNWYPGNKNGEGGIFNFVTKRGLCKGKNSKISWTQVETGSSITWKYPSVILKGKKSIGNFYSISLMKNKQQADTGSKMIHIGEKTKSTIISKGISINKSNNTYRGLIKILPNANKSKNFSQCDSLLIGNNCKANTYPCIENQNKSSIIEHEATTSKISKKIILYCAQRGINIENTISIVITGFCKEIFKKLPLEFAIEAQKLIEINLQNKTG